MIFSRYMPCVCVCVLLACPGLCGAVSPTDLLEELVAVRSENFGRLISWRGVVDFQEENANGDVHHTDSRRTCFFVDVAKSRCRSVTSPIIPEKALSRGASVNFIAMMKKDGEFYTLRSFKQITDRGTLLEYRPVEVFATLSEIPGNGDYFDPLTHWDYNTPEDDMPSRLLSALRAGVDVLARASIRLEGPSLILEGGEGDRCTFDLAKGGLMSSLEGGRPLKERWSASHVNVGGIWLPSVVRSEQVLADSTHVSETVWKDHEVNISTQGEFTLAAMGAYKGLRLLDHVRNSQRTLVGTDYLPQPTNLWSEGNRPGDGGIWRRWLLWINAAIVLLVIASFALRHGIRNRYRS